MKYLKLIRFENLISMVLIQYLIRYSLIIPTFGQENTIGNIDFCFLVFSMILVAAGAYVINDYFDIQVDKAHKLTKSFLKLPGEQALYADLI